MDVAVNLAIADPKDFRKTVAQARKFGLKVTQAFDELGVASGRIDRAQLATLRRLPGVQVEEDRSVSTY